MTRPETPKTELKPIDDTGYTKVCPWCSERHGFNPFKRGKPREIHIVSCTGCEAKPLTQYDRSYRRGLP